MADKEAEQPKQPEPDVAIPALILEGKVDDDAGMKSVDICMPTPGVSWYDRCFAGFSLQVCRPEIPCLQKVTEPQFFGKDDKMSFFAALIMGAQHALGMTGGIVTTPSLVAGDTCRGNADPEMCESMPYLINATLLASGLLTLVQVFRFKLWCLPGNYYIGTGLVSVLGPSFAFLPIAREATMSGVGEPGGAVAAYGEFLGTACVAALFEIGFALLSPRLIGKVFPPIVCGVAITCIGASLTGAGIKYWGGGVFCMENDLSKLPLWAGFPQMCQNGDVGHLAAGAPEHVGMGFMVVCIMVLIEIFGAPFWKNANVVISLLLAYFISMGLSVTPPATDENPNPEPHDYVNFRFTKLTAEETPIVFFWVRRFPLGFNAAYLLPLILAFFVSTAETVGDIGATLDASELPSYGPDADTRVQGGLLADGVSSLLAALFTTSPNTTYSQNSGVIAITRCASRASGLATALWLILLGLVGPVGGFFADIPYPIVGGMVTFLFANVMVSGIIVLSKLGIKRRNRIILSFSLGIALGVAMQPNFFEGGGSATFAGNWLKMNYGFWPLKRVCKSGTEVYDLDKGPDWVTSCEFNTGLKSLRQAVLLALKTPYSIGTLIALILNLILPKSSIAEE